MPDTIKHNLTDREHAHILYALRRLQDDLNESGEDTAEEMRDSEHIGGEGLEPMTDAELDNLCERLNLASIEALSERGWKPAAAAALKQAFPWLGTDEPAEGADVVAELAELAAEWENDTTESGLYLVEFDYPDNCEFWSNFTIATPEEIKRLEDRFGQLQSLEYVDQVRITRCDTRTETLTPDALVEEAKSATGCKNDDI